MLTLFHSPHTRATRMYQLLVELGALDEVRVQTVDVKRSDGSGAPDAQNPHPEGKVPLLVHDGEAIWESSAIALYLTDMFPKAGLGPQVGDALRGRYLSWLAWYGDVVEPVVHFQAFGIDHPALASTFRGMPEVRDRLATALEAAPYLVGEDYTAADLLVYSAFSWLPQMLPDHPAIKAWGARCAERPAAKAAADYEANL